MVKWAGGVSRNYIYIPDMGKVADQVTDEFIKVLRERRNIVRAVPTKISTGLIWKRKRPAITVSGLGMQATIAVIAVGPDLYIGYVISTGKGELNDLEMQDLEAFSSYLVHTIELTIEKLGVVI